MSAATIDPDDDGHVTYEDHPVNCYAHDGVPYRSFPIRWDDAGRPVFAAEKIDPKTGASEFRIVVNGETEDDVAGCACPDCAPHEQYGPIPVPWQVDHGLRDRCAGVTRAGKRCSSTTSHPSGYCGLHKAQRIEADA